MNNDFFYYMLLFFIALEIFHVFRKKRIFESEAKREAMFKEALAYLMSTGDFKGYMGKIWQYIKSEFNKLNFIIRICNLIYSIWIPLGILFYPPRLWFIMHLVMSTLITMLPIFISDKSKKYEIKVFGSIISIIILCIILQQHFRWI